MRVILLFVCFIVINTTSNAGGPWTQKKGYGYYKLSEWWVNWDQHYDVTGSVLPNDKAGFYRSAVYGEYGITDGVTIIANLPFFVHTLVESNKNARLSGMGDMDLGVKFAILRGSIPVAGTFSLGIPFGKSVIKEGYLLETGDGEFNQALKIDVGRGFKIRGLSSYFSAYTGYNIRHKGYSDEWLAGMEWGLGFLKDKMWFSIKSNMVESMKNGEKRPVHSSTTFYSNNQEYISYEVGLSYRLTNDWGVSMGSAGAFRGESLPARPSYSVGVFWTPTKTKK